MDKLYRIILGIGIGISCGIFCAVIGLQFCLHNSDIRELKKEVKKLCSDDEAFKLCFKELGFKIGFEESEQIAAEKADQMYYEEMFSQPKMNLPARNPTIIIPAYNERFIGMHPELKGYFVRVVSPREIFSTNLENHTGEKIYLLEKGTCKCIAVTNLECSGVIRDEEHWEFLKPRHQIDISWEAITKIYKQPCLWYLKNSHIIDPFIYRHPKGAVIWVKDVEKLRIKDVGPVYGRL